MSYSEELKIFLSKYQYQKIAVGNAEYRYVSVGEENLRALVF